MRFSSRRNAILSFAVLVGIGVAGCQSEDPAGLEQGTLYPGDITVQSSPVDLNAPWFLLRPDQQVINGTGTTTLEGMPAGQYRLIWGAVGGWYSPTPNPVQHMLGSGAEIEFSATYTEIMIETGSIAVDSNPDQINAPWTLTGPSGFVLQGTGDQVLDGREPGDYVLTFGTVQNYDTAGTQQGVLEAGGRLDFAGDYIYNAPPTSGTLLIDITPDSINAPWTVLDPTGQTHNGNGDASIADMPVGAYAISFNAVEGWDPPSPSVINRIIQDGEFETVFALYSEAQAPNPNDPQIEEATGNFGNGNTVTISGAEFGTHTMDITSGLGPNGWIDNNGAGTHFPSMSGANGWVDGESSFSGSFISSDEAYSGNNSVRTYIGRQSAGLCDSPQCWQGAYNYDHGGSFDKVFASFRIYFDPINLSSDRTQLKIWRVNATGINGINSSEEIYNRMRFNNGGNGYYDWGTMLYCNLDCDSSPFDFGEQYCSQNLVADPEWRDKPGLTTKHFYAQYHDHVGADKVGYAETMPAPRTWNRIDAYVAASGEDQFDGAYTLNMHRPNEARKLIINVSGLATHKSQVCRPGTDGRWRYWVFQNYLDDDGGPFNGERADVYIDDIYLQFGTRSRVEIGDQPVYANCRKLEIQTPTDWADGSITVEMNHGSFAPGSDVFLFVVRDDGSVNPGLPVRLQ